MGGRITSIVRVVGGTIVAIPLIGLLAAGPSLAWVWIGSQLQGGTKPSGTALVTVIAGLALTYGVIAMMFAWIKGRTSGDRRRVRYAWNRSLRDERDHPMRTHVLEDIVVVATVVVAAGVTVWFFFFGHPGVPIGY